MWATIGQVLLKLLETRKAADVIIILIGVAVICGALAYGLGLVTVDAFATEAYVNREVGAVRQKLIQQIEQNREAAKSVSLKVDEIGRQQQISLEKQLSEQLQQTCRRRQDAETRDLQVYFDGEMTKARNEYQTLMGRPWQGPPGC